MEEQNGNQNNNKLTEAAKNKAKQTAKKKGIRVVRNMIVHALMGLASLFFQFWPIIMIVCVVAGIFDFAVEMTVGQKTPNDIMTQLEVEDLSELVEIKEYNRWILL